MHGMERPGGGRYRGLAVSATFSGVWTYEVRLGIGTTVGAGGGADDPRGGVRQERKGYAQETVRITCVGAGGGGFVRVAVGWGR